MGRAHDLSAQWQFLCVRHPARMEVENGINWIIGLFVTTFHIVDEHNHHFSGRTITNAHKIYRYDYHLVTWSYNTSHKENSLTLPWCRPLAMAIAVDRSSAGDVNCDDAVGSGDCTRLNGIRSIEIDFFWQSISIVYSDTATITLSPPLSLFKWPWNIHTLPRTIQDELSNCFGVRDKTISKKHVQNACVMNSIVFFFLLFRNFYSHVNQTCLSLSFVKSHWNDVSHLLLWICCYSLLLIFFGFLCLSHTHKYEARAIADRNQLVSCCKWEDNWWIDASSSNLFTWNNNQSFARWWSFNMHHCVLCYYSTRHLRRRNNFSFHSMRMCGDDMRRSLSCCVQPLFIRFPCFRYASLQ